MANQCWPPNTTCATVSTLSHDSALNCRQTQWVVKVAQTVATATITSNFVRKPFPSNFDPLFLFEPSFQHCHMSQLWIFHKLSGLQWWHKSSLRKHFCHVLSKNHVQANLTFFSFLGHRFNTVTWLSIELANNPVGCYGEQPSLRQL